MMRRWFLLVLVLCLPLRLWAGAGVMVASEPVAHAAMGGVSVEVLEHDCHSTSMSEEAAPAAEKHDCRVCTICHMQALHGVPLLDMGLKAPQSWQALSARSDYPSPGEQPFKPPVSFV